jgi:iron complex transport system ATP-binding protein
MSSPAVLTASGVSVRRDGSTLLTAIDLEVHAGERWALLGGNGAGKSTLLAVLGARRFPTAGSVHVLGHRLGEVAVHDLWPLIGQVHSGHVPSGRLTGRQVALTGQPGTAALPLRWQPSPALVDRVDALLATLGVDRVADHPWTTLSAGERGRVLVARALVNDPPLLLLDEPASGLDLPARERLVAALDGLAREQPDRAGVLVTHHLEELPASTTHAALLRAGRLLVAGPVEQVLTDRWLSDCFDLPLSVRRESGRWVARSHPPELSASDKNAREMSLRGT